MKKLCVLFAVALVMLTAGCNTVRGIGQDIGLAGEALQKASKQ